jgi:hypothetical protein
VCILFVLGLVWLWRRTKDEDDCEILRFEIYTVQYPVLLVQYEDNEDGVYILVAENGDRKVRKQNEKKKNPFLLWPNRKDRETNLPRNAPRGGINTRSTCLASLSSLR